MNSSFWHDFLANFLSDLFVGAILGTALGWWIGKKLGAFERGEQRRDDKRTELQKAMRYLDLLKSEIDNLLSESPVEIETFQKHRQGIELKISTPFWDVLQPSGELPKLLDPRVLASLAQFYDWLMYAKQGRDLVIDGTFRSDVARNVVGIKDTLDKTVVLAEYSHPPTGQC